MNTLKASMNQVLYMQVTNMKCNNIVDFHEWLAEVKCVDDKKCFEHNQAVKAFEQSAASNCAASHADNTLLGPSCKGNTCCEYTNIFPIFSLI